MPVFSSSKSALCVGAETVSAHESVQSERTGVADTFAKLALMRIVSYVAGSRFERLIGEVVVPVELPGRSLFGMSVQTLVEA